MGKKLRKYCQILVKKKLSKNIKDCEEYTIQTIKIFHRESPNCTRKDFAKESKDFADVQPHLSEEVVFEVLSGRRFKPYHDKSVPAKKKLNLYHGTTKNESEEILRCGIDTELPHSRVFPGEITRHGVFFTPDLQVARGFGGHILEITTEAKNLEPYLPNATLKESLELGESQAILIKPLPPNQVKLHSFWNDSTQRWELV